ncbi:hypothetical protein [Shinella sp. BYT-45]|uniref:DUF7736 domain-containing protein n=1 Tax=Shinella sp. BYT-45 TaxID=3377377 RepID=UPI00397F4BD3
MTQRLTKEQAAIIGAYTGITASNFSVVHEYAERKLGRPIWTHEFADEGLTAELKEASREDFLSIVYEEVAA